jgi:hypothetical protein
VKSCETKIGWPAHGAGREPTDWTCPDLVER